MSKISIPSLDSRLLLPFYLFASVFAALASYRMHIEGLEEGVFPIFQALIEMEGRAPDQYRILPYLLIQAIRELLQIVIGQEITPKYPVIIFDALFLCLSCLLLKRIFTSINVFPVTLVLLLIYPYLMFDGYRPVESFILFLCVTITAVLVLADRKYRPMKFLGLLAVLSFTRADVALLMALAGLAFLPMALWQRTVAIAIPLAVQWVLSCVLFPDAEYFSTVVMLADNFSGRFLFASPVTYLLIATAVAAHRQIKEFFTFTWQRHRSVLLLLLAYGAVLLVIARPNEYRLFLPMLPIVLILLSEKNQAMLAAKHLPKTSHAE
jgi:hypothetical protein